MFSSFLLNSFFVPASFLLNCLLVPTSFLLNCLLVPPSFVFKLFANAFFFLRRALRERRSPWPKAVHYPHIAQIADFEGQHGTVIQRIPQNLIVPWIIAEPS